MIDHWPGVYLAGEAGVVRGLHITQDELGRTVGVSGPEAEHGTGAGHRADELVLRDGLVVGRLLGRLQDAWGVVGEAVPEAVD